jgi:small subunit ribosomal protein S21
MSIEVRIEPGRPIEVALRQFKKLVDREGILQRFKEIERFQKPSTKKHLAQIELRRKIRKAKRKMAEFENQDVSNKLVPNF